MDETKVYSHLLYRLVMQNNSASIDESIKTKMIPDFIKSLHNSIPKQYSKFKEAIEQLSDTASLNFSKIKFLNKLLNKYSIPVQIDPVNLIKAKLERTNLAERIIRDLGLEKDFFAEEGLIIDFEPMRNITIDDEVLHRYEISIQFFRDAELGGAKKHKLEVHIDSNGNIFDLIDKSEHRRVDANKDGQKNR
jgi:hypothetical protein